MKKILITGGTTFVSKYAAKYFSERGYEVYVLNRNSKTQVEGVTLIQGNRHELGEKLKSVHFDVVADITAYDAEDIIDLCDALGSFDQYIMISTSAVYPENSIQPVKEETQIRANVYWEKYGSDKIDAERILLQRVPDAYILRPPYLYGPMNNLYREAFVFDCAKEGRKFYLPKDGKMKLQFFHVRDLCGLMQTIIETKPLEHIMNVGNAETVSIKEWVTMCYACFDKTPVFENIYVEADQRDYFSFCDYEYCLDVERQQKVYPHTIALKEGLMESATWYALHEKEVDKKMYIKYIDENFIMNEKIELAIATDFQGEGKYLEDIRQTLENISKAGFTHIHWCHEWDGDYLYSVYEMEQIKAWMDAYHLKAKALHATKGTKRAVNRAVLHARRDYTSDWECSRKAGVELIKNRVDLAAYIGAKEIVLHLYPPFISIADQEIKKEAFYENVKKSFDELYPYCMEKGVRICVENLFDMPREYVEEMWDWVIRTYPAEYMGVCFDSGHANMIWRDEAASMIEKYRERIFAVHLHDNFGAVDYHMIPGEGNICWEKIMRVLCKSVYELPLILELDNDCEEEMKYLQRVYEAGVKLNCMYKEAQKACEE